MGLFSDQSPLREQISLTSNRNTKHSTAVKKDNESVFSAAFSANLRRNYGGRGSISKAGPAKPIKKQAQILEESHSVYEKRHPQPKATINERALEKDNKERDPGLSYFNGLPSMEELKAEYVAKMKSLREQQG